jgi:hypothetical protein
MCRYVIQVERKMGLFGVLEKREHCPGGRSFKSLELPKVFQ